MRVPFSAAEEANSPLRSIPYLLNNYDGSNAADIFASVAGHFAERFASSPEQFMQVPVLSHETAETLPANTLVRFRGMIVDMFNPEFFLGTYKTPDGCWKPAALYTDATPHDIDQAVDTRIMERRPLLLVPVPHEQPWAAAAWAGQPVEPQTPGPTDRAKRGRERPLTWQHQEQRQQAQQQQLQNSQIKRASRQEATCLVGAVSQPGCQTALMLMHPSVRSMQCLLISCSRTRTCPGAAFSSSSSSLLKQQQQQQQQHWRMSTSSSSPSTSPATASCSVCGDADKFQLHDVVEVLGVLSVTPCFAAMHLQQQEQPEQQQHRRAAAADGNGMAADGAAAGAAAAEGEGLHNHRHHAGGDDVMDHDVMEVDDSSWWQQERAAALPPTSQVMRLHAFCIRKAQISTSSSTSSSPAISSAPPAADQQASHVLLLRQRALALLAAPLAGDELAAEYLLLTLLSSVMSRDAAGAPGMIPLNLTHLPSNMGGSSNAAQLVPGLATALRCLLPRVALLPLNLPELNRARWYPQQSPVSGRLFRGRLQLAEGTLLVLDETDMAAGELGDAGVKNLQAVQQVLTQQQLPCGCQVYTQNLPVNQPAVVLSSGRSILRDSLAVQLPLQPQRPVLVKPNGGQTLTGGGGGGHQGVVAWAEAEVAGAEAVAAAAAGMPELAAVREYIAAARGLQCRMEQSAAEQCVARFRAQQRLDPGFGFGDLDIVVTLSKLLSLSLGHELFQIESWERVMQMEAQRKQRLMAAVAAAQ